MKLFSNILAASTATIIFVSAEGESSTSPDSPDSPVIATVTVPDPPIPPPTQTGCPTVTVTGELCTTCGIPECLAVSTVTQSCGCPSAIPTVTVDFPCEKGCKGVFCSTSYSYVTGTVTDSCVPSEPTSTDPNPDKPDPQEPTPSPPTTPNEGRRVGGSMAAAAALFAAVGIL